MSRAYTPKVGERVWFAAIAPYLVNVTRTPGSGLSIVYGRPDGWPDFMPDEYASTHHAFPDTEGGREELAQWCIETAESLKWKAKHLREQSDEVAA